MSRVLITGATAGIGRVAALHLARAGHEVFASGRRREALESLERESGGKVRGIPFDVTDEAAIGAAAKEIDEHTGGYGLDALVNNAGYGQGGPLELISDTELRAQYDTNVFGLMAVTRAFLPRMRERRAGRIVNVGSVAGSIALPFLGAYASTKHAVQGLSESLRKELRPHGVHVVVIRPGAIRTEFGVTEAEGLRQLAGPESPYRRQLEIFIPWHARLHPRAPDPMTVARAIEAAVAAPRPRPYYVVPAYNTGALWLQKLLPARAFDWVLERATGLARVDRAG
ncbi:MAG: SDR family oxidoreductase [Myxococcota bacterium]|nr:SDR family oxidoreductase [Myxococcota bacterium]